MSHSTSVTFPGTWYLQLSNRKLWDGKRNIHTCFTTSNSLCFTYQEHDAPDVKSRDEKELEVVATGKDGKLESWMTEMDGWIEDTSGKRFC